MITAEVKFPTHKLAGIRHPAEYFGLDWNTYEEISEELGKSRGLHLTFYQGTLTIMPLTELHELLVSFLDRLVTLTGMYLQKNIIPTGQATLRAKSKLIGVEPDLSYFVSPAAGHKIKDHVLNEIDSPPDIVVEIDVFHTSGDKFEIYAELGISEFWRHIDGRLEMYVLQDGSYLPVEKSVQIPILTSQVLGNFLNRAEDEEQFKILSKFQDWLRNS